MYCPRCGNRIEPGVRFCSRCGYQTDLPAAAYGVPEKQSNASWIIGIITAAIALATMVGLILIALTGGGANTGGNTGGSLSAGQIAGTWQLISYENETGKTDMTAANTQVTFAADGTLSTSGGNISTLQATHWVWTDQDTIEISGGGGDAIMDIAFGQVGGKEGFTAVVSNAENPDKKEILTFVKADGAQGSGAGEDTQGAQTPQGTQQTNGVDIGQMTLQELQGEWRGTGVLTSLENIEKYVWNWEQLTAEEAALYNSMVGVENTCYFGIDQYNNIGCELLAPDTYWRGIADEGAGTTLVNGELSASTDIAQQYTCRIHAVLSVDDDGVLMLRGTVDTIIYEGPLNGPYDEVTYSISFAVKKFD